MTARNVRSDAARAAILAAAVELVGETGYPRLTVDAIAARAGVGKQTIYRWWPSKGAVLFEAIRGGDATAPPALPDTGDLERDLRTVLRATAAEFRDPTYDTRLRALTLAVLEDDDLAAAYRDTLETPLREAKKDRLRAARHAGQLDPDVDLDLAVDAIWAPMAQRWLLRTGPLTRTYADRLVATALRGLRPPPAARAATAGADGAAGAAGVTGETGTAGTAGTAGETSSTRRTRGNPR